MQEIGDTVIPVPLVIAVSGHRILVVAEVCEKERIGRAWRGTQIDRSSTGWSARPRKPNYLWSRAGSLYVAFFACHTLCILW